LLTRESDPIYHCTVKLTIEKPLPAIDQQMIPGSECG
jgi:hypothetical protein